MINKEKWSMVYQDHYPTLLKNMTGRMRGNREGAEDIVQSVFARLMEKIPDPETRGDLGGYLQQSVINLSIDLYRKGLNHIANSDGIDFELFEAADQTEQIVYETIRNELLVKAIHSLPNEFVETMLLLSQGHEYKEIAEKLSIPIGTVKTRISRAKEQLKSQNLYR